MRVTGLASLLALSMNPEELDSGAVWGTRKLLPSSFTSRPLTRARSRFLAPLRATNKGHGEGEKMIVSVEANRPQSLPLRAAVSEAKELSSKLTQISADDLLADSKEAQELAKLFRTQLQDLKDTLAEIEKYAPKDVAEKIAPIEVNAEKIGQDALSAANTVTSILQDSKTLAREAGTLFFDISKEYSDIKEAIKGTKKPIELLNSLPDSLTQIEKDFEEVLGTNQKIIQKVRKLFSAAVEIMTDARTLGSLLTVLFDRLLHRAPHAIDHAISQIQPITEHAVSQVQPVADQIAAQGPAVMDNIQRFLQ
jgi:hypothetical protein